jgi:hypothetical protein
MLNNRHIYLTDGRRYMCLSLGLLALLVHRRLATSDGRPQNLKGDPNGCHRLAILGTGAVQRRAGASCHPQHPYSGYPPPLSR